MSKYITVAYQLYADMANGRELIEEAYEWNPFQFITELGLTLDTFEAHIAPLKKGDSFDFTLSVDEAYGPRIPELVQELPKSVFEIDGKFDHVHIYEGAVVPLMNEEGQRFPGTVVQVTPTTVTVDLNNPLAGKELQYVGKVVEHRDATNAEIEETLKAFSCGGCGGCGDDECSGGCSKCGR